MLRLQEHHHQPSAAWRDLLVLLGIDFLLYKTEKKTTERTTTTSLPRAVTSREEADSARSQLSLATPKSKREGKDSKKKNSRKKKGEGKEDFDVSSEVQKNVETKVIMILCVWRFQLPAS